MKPLDGVVVLDATQGVSGPYCSLLLAGVGARVIRVEPPDGDWLRALGPPWIGGTGAAAAHLNRGKETVALDLTCDAGRMVLRRLLGLADVLLHELTAEQAEAWGLDPESLRGFAPDLIDCAVTPLGETGPWAGQPATELEVQSLAGTGRYLGSLDAPPLRVGADVGGVLAGCTAFHAVLAALLARDDAGGQHAAVSQLGALIGTATVMIAALDRPDAWVGFHCNAATYPPDQGIATADDRLYYGQPLRSEQAWQDFCHDIGADVLLDDPRFATRADRMPHMAELRQELAPYFARFPTAELMELIVRSDGIGVPMQDYAALMAHPQPASMGQVVQTDQGPALGLPWRRRDDELDPPAAAVRPVGADTAAVLAEAGIPAAEVAELITAGIVRGPAGFGGEQRGAR